MTPENFCYWLQGLLEVGKPTTLDEEQIKMITQHLNLVFVKKSSDSTNNIFKDLFSNPKQPYPLVTPNKLEITC